MSILYSPISPSQRCRADIDNPQHMLEIAQHLHNAADYITLFNDILAVYRAVRLHTDATKTDDEP